MSYHKGKHGKGRVKNMEQSEISRIGRILKERRLQLGYTQEYAAEKAGISLVDMGITPHIPTQNRTCAINAYGFSLYIWYSICKTNSL